MLFHQKLESIQDNACVETTDAIRLTSKENLTKNSNHFQIILEFHPFTTGNLIQDALATAYDLESQEISKNQKISKLHEETCLASLAETNFRH